jgi:glycosyltransferase involved in cell wall biosynthesis
VEVGKIIKATKKLKPGNYYLIVSRVVGAKGIELAVQAARKAGVNLKIVGEPAGLRWLGRSLDELKGEGVEFLGRVSDQKLYNLYGRCRAFLALAENEDFGITPVEAMAAGRPVIAFRGGGYLESVIEGKTGVFFDGREPGELARVIKKFDASMHRIIGAEDCQKQAKKFSKERFKKEIKTFVKENLE